MDAPVAPIDDSTTELASAGRGPGPSGTAAAVTAGLSVEDGRLCVVVVERHPLPRVLEVAEADLGPEVVRAGKVLDGAGLARRLGALWRTLDLGGVPTIVGVQPADAVVDVVELGGGMARGALPAEVRHALGQVKSHYRLPEHEDPAWAWSPLPARPADATGDVADPAAQGTTPGRAAVCLAVARRVDLVPLVEAARRSGVLVDAVEPAAAAAVRALVPGLDPQGTRSGVAVVPWSGGHLLTVVIEGALAAAPWREASPGSPAVVPGWYAVAARELRELLGRPDGAERRLEALLAAQPTALPIASAGRGLALDTPPVGPAALVALGLALGGTDRGPVLDWRRSLLVGGVGGLRARGEHLESIDREPADRDLADPEPADPAAGTGLGVVRQPAPALVGAVPVVPPGPVVSILSAAIEADRSGEPVAADDAEEARGTETGVGPDAATGSTAVLGPDVDRLLPADGLPATVGSEPVPLSSGTERKRQLGRLAAFATVAAVIAAGTFFAVRASGGDGEGTGTTPVTADPAATNPTATNPTATNPTETNPTAANPTASTSASTSTSLGTAATTASSAPRASTTSSSSPGPTSTTARTASTTAGTASTTTTSAPLRSRDAGVEADGGVPTASTAPGSTAR